MSLNGDYSGKTKCLPTYLLLDTSGTMKPHEALLNATLDHVHTSLVSSPRVAEFAHISIITFNTSAHLVLEMTDIEEVQVLPQLTCGGQTNFGTAFDMVRQRIDMDVPALRASNKAVLRPAVFLLTDGQPTDAETWAGHFASLVDTNWPRRPHVLTFGFGGATVESLKGMATKAAFLAKKNLEDKEALSRMLTTLLNTLVASAPVGALVVPADLPGFERIPVDYVE
jgi:uncharacterized protein YegL